MFNKKKNKTLAFALYLGFAALSALAANVQADSLRFKWTTNNHFYMRFDQAVTWTQAQTNCKALGAHSVTITSDAERGFIAANISSGTFWIGASDAAVEGKNVWVTGEPWVYDYWSTSYINTSTDDYIFSYDWRGWGFGTATGTAIYICEWSANNYVGIATVPDLNANGSPEIAALYVNYINGLHTVKIRDPKTDVVLSTLSFKAAWQAPQGLVVLKDINGNGVPEIGVLYLDYGQPGVLIKDAKNNTAYLNPVRFLDTNYNPQSMTVVPDSNGNGSNEITVLGIGKLNNVPKAETRDSLTGALLNDTTF